MTQTFHCDRCGTLIPQTVKAVLRVMAGNTEKMKFDLCAPCQTRLEENLLKFLSTITPAEQKTMITPGREWPQLGKP